MESLASVVRESHAAGALLTGTGLAQSPPFPIDALMQQPAAAAPVYVLSELDASGVVSALEKGELTARLSADAKRETGADEQHRPLVYISRPNAPGSSIAHLEPLLRPDQLMEPATGVLPTHNLALTIAMLADMGWSAGCGDGMLAEGEACDEGARNTDHAADSCRSDCTRPRCGDAVRDKGEDCDQGFANRDDQANACRSDCRAAHCGDGVLDQGESCDTGRDNNDSRPNACRSHCMPARCGDGVVDAREACDEGAKNSDSRADACRMDCSVARCGDKVVDEGEACDDGPNNSATRPDVCRADCSMPRCGDGILDTEEACDTGDDNSDTRADACRQDCTPARCGDGVVDAEESCDGTSDCDARCRPAKRTPAHNEADAGGCGCRIAPHAPGRHGWLGMLIIALVLFRRIAKPAEPV
jgi:MYXO-CTERM domain-containing protein